MSESTDTTTTTTTADDDHPLPSAPVRAAEKERFREPTQYEKDLRAENAKLRRRAQEAEQALERRVAELTAATAGQVTEAKTAAEAALAAARAEFEAAINAAKEATATAVTEARTATEQAAQQRVIRAEVRAAAIAAGMQHLRGLDLLDLSPVTVDEKGNVVIPEDFFAKAKEEMAFLFTDPKTTAGDPPRTTSTTTETPKPAQATKKKASEMTDEEWKAANAYLSSTGKLPAT